MSNKLDKQYQDLLQTILEHGVDKNDRTGTGTKSIFGYTIRHKMSDGFPLLTTKKMAWKTMVTELIWFLRGDTNIKYLVDNNCHIWDGDAYKNYLKEHSRNPNETAGLNNGTPFNKDEFIALIQSSDAFAKKWGDLGPVYGKQWRNWGKDFKQIPNEDGSKVYHITTIGIDQISNLINDLKTNPDSRRLMVSAWNVGELDQMVLPPCHYSWQVYTRELSTQERYVIARSQSAKYKCPKWDTIDTDVNGNPILRYSDTQDEHYDKYGIPKRAISLMWNQRSVDVPLGLPFNIASYGLLLEIIAKTVNMVPDELIGNLGDCHIYQNQIEGSKEQITREPFKLPTLNINTEFWQTESGECGEGPLNAIAIFNSFKDDNFCKCLLEDDIQLSNYQSHSKINFPLSN
jgi:thymidylate synthase